MSEASAAGPLHVIFNPHFDLSSHAPSPSPNDDKVMEKPAAGAARRKCPRRSPGGTASVAQSKRGRCSPCLQRTLNSTGNATFAQPISPLISSCLCKEHVRSVVRVQLAASVAALAEASAPDPLQTTFNPLHLASHAPSALSYPNRLILQAVLLHLKPNDDKLMLQHSERSLSGNAQSCPSRKRKMKQYNRVIPGKGQPFKATSPDHSDGPQ